MMEENLQIEKLTLMERVKFFFIKPGKVFEQYIIKPTFGLKLLIICIALALTGYAMSTQSNVLLQQMIDNYKKLNPNVTQSAIDTIMNYYKVVTGAPFLIFSALIGAIITIFLVSLVYWIISKIFKSEASYKDTVAVYTLAYMPMAIANVLLSIFTLCTNSSFLISSSLQGNLVNKILISFNPFTIWQIVLLVIGLAKVGNISKKNSAIIVGLLTLIHVLYFVFTMK
jgi:hypothetical protein